MGPMHVAWELGSDGNVAATIDHATKKAVTALLQTVGAKGSGRLTEKTELLVTRARVSLDEWRLSLTLQKALAQDVPIVAVEALEDEHVMAAWRAAGEVPVDVLAPYRVPLPHPDELSCLSAPPADEEDRWWEAIGTDTGAGTWGDPRGVEWREWTAADGEGRFHVSYHQGFRSTEANGCVEVHAVQAAGGDGYTYRVFLQHASQCKVSPLTSDVAAAEDLYAAVYAMLEKTGTKVQRMPRGVGHLPPVLDMALPAHEAAAREQAIDPAVRTTLAELFAASWGKLKQYGMPLGMDQDDDDGGFCGLSLEDVTKAAGLLEAVQSGALTGAARRKALAKYRSTLMLAAADGDDLDLDAQQDLLFLLNAALSTGEYTGGHNIYTAPLYYQYASLETDIRVVSGERRDSIIDSIIASAGAADKARLEVLDVLELYKQDQHAAFERDISNHALLMHGTDTGNITHILASGLQVPRFQRRRRDKGLLGKGIYFGSSISTAMKYVSSADEDGCFYVLLCNVALGRVSSVSTVQSDLTAAPEGFDSVLGQPADSGAGAFSEREYCVYRAAQHEMKYLVRLRCADDTLARGAVQAEGPRADASGFACVQDLHAEADADLAPLGNIDAVVVDQPKVGLQFQLGGGEWFEAPLQEITVGAKLLDCVGEVEIFQRYCNKRSENVEGKYVFPLQHGAAVCGFEAFINDKHLVGITKEKEQAKKEYKEAVAAGKGAYLLDEVNETPDVFTVSVGNLPPQCEVVIKITYVTELEIDHAAGCIRWSLPSSAHPTSKLTALPSTSGTDTHVAHAATGVQIEVGIAMPWNIESLNASHDIRLKKSDQHATICLAPTVTPYDITHNDFVLDIALANIGEPRMWVEEQEGCDTNAAMVCFFPQPQEATWTLNVGDEEGESKAKEAVYEVLLLLDCSASMRQGGAMGDAKTAALATLNRLGTSRAPKAGAIRVNVAAFGSDLSFAFAKPAVATAEAIKKAAAWVTELAPSKGGTHLAHVWARLGSLRKPITVYLYTDGLFGSHYGAVLRGLRAGGDRRGTPRGDSLRVFTFGVGKACCSHAVRSVARVGRGASEVLNPARKSEWAGSVKNHVAKLGKGVLVAPTVDWSGESIPALKALFDRSVTQSPAALPNLFHGERTIVYALTEKIPRRAEMKVAHYRDDPAGAAACEERHLVAPWPSHYIHGSVLHKLAARSVVREWEDGMYEVDAYAHEAKRSIMKEEMIRVGIQYNIVTQFTSMVAIEERSEEEKERLRRGDVACTTPTIASLRHSVDVLPEQQFRTLSDVLREEADDRAMYARLNLPGAAAAVQPPRRPRGRKRRKPEQKRTRSEAGAASIATEEAADSLRAILAAGITDEGYTAKAIEGDRGLGRGTALVGGTARLGASLHMARKARKVEEVDSPLRNESEEAFRGIYFEQSGAPGAAACEIECADLSESCLLEEDELEDDQGMASGAAACDIECADLCLLEEDELEDDLGMDFMNFMDCAAPPPPPSPQCLAPPPPPAPRCVAPPPPPPPQCVAPPPPPPPRCVAPPPPAPQCVAPPPPPPPRCVAPPPPAPRCVAPPPPPPPRCVAPPPPPPPQCVAPPPPPAPRCVAPPPPPPPQCVAPPPPAPRCVAPPPPPPNQVPEKRKKKGKEEKEEKKEKEIGNLKKQDIASRSSVTMRTWEYSRQEEQESSERSQNKKRKAKPLPKAKKRKAKPDEVRSRCSSVEMEKDVLLGVGSDKGGFDLLLLDVTPLEIGVLASCPDPHVNRRASWHVTLDRVPRHFTRGDVLRVLHPFGVVQCIDIDRVRREGTARVEFAEPSGAAKAYLADVSQWNPGALCGIAVQPSGQSACMVEPWRAFCDRVAGVIRTGTSLAALDTLLALPSGAAAAFLRDCAPDCRSNAFGPFIRHFAAAAVRALVTQYAAAFPVEDAAFRASAAYAAVVAVQGAATNCLDALISDADPPCLPYSAQLEGMCTWEAFALRCLRHGSALLCPDGGLVVLHALENPPPRPAGSGSPPDGDAPFSVDDVYRGTFLTRTDAEEEGRGAAGAPCGWDFTSDQLGLRPALPDDPGCSAVSRHAIVRRNCTIPTRQRGVFTTSRDYQTSIALRFYEGSADDVFYTTSVAVPPRPRGAIEVTVVVDIDANGNVHVGAAVGVLAGGQQPAEMVAVEINKKSCSEIEAVIKADEAAGRLDAAYRNECALLANLETRVRAALPFPENGGPRSVSEREALDACNAASAALQPPHSAAADPMCFTVPASLVTPDRLTRLRHFTADFAATTSAYLIRSQAGPEPVAPITIPTVAELD